MGKRYIVTGGGGFVGRALSMELRRRGHEVTSFSRGHYPELEAVGIISKQVDIGSSVDSWAALCEGHDGVFHTAAKVDMWGDYESFFATNVMGTRNIIEACRRAGIKNLVFTSSPSVIHDGYDLCGVDESYPYPETFDAWYPQTKAQAEQEVRGADRIGGLRTVALRPHLIWGPHDTNLIPTILERAKAGRLTRIGNGMNVVDLLYIDDCVEAHMRAMRALEESPDAVGGKVYFISQGDPVRMWEWIDQVLVAHGLSPITRSIPARLAHGVAAVMEVCARALGAVGVQTTPLLTRFLVSEMSTHHYFDISAARKDLGYQPSCTIAEAMERTFGNAGETVSRSSASREVPQADDVPAVRAT